VERLNEHGKLDLSILHGDGSNTVAKKGAKKSAIRGINIRKNKTNSWLRGLYPRSRFFTATIYPQLLQVFGGFINNLFISYPQEVLVCDRGNILLSAP